MDKENYLSRHRKVFLIVGGVVLLLAVIILIINALTGASLNSTVTILVTPREAKVSINGAMYTNGIYQIQPMNNAKVEISLPGFETKSMEMNFNAHSSSAINEYLLDEAGGFSYYETNEDDYEILKLIANDEKALKFIGEFEKVLSIRDYLPLEGSVQEKDKYYSVSVEINENTDECTNIVCLDVWTGSDLDNKKIAKRFLQKYGFNIENYQVFYHTYTPSSLVENSE